MPRDVDRTASPGRGMPGPRYTALIIPQSPPSDTGWSGSVPSGPPQDSLLTTGSFCCLDTSEAMTTED